MADLTALTARLRAHLPGVVDADLQTWLNEAAKLEGYPGGATDVAEADENLVVLRAALHGCTVLVFQTAPYFSFSDGAGRQVNKSQVSANYRALLPILQGKYDQARGGASASQSLSRADGR